MNKEREVGYYFVLFPYSDENKWEPAQYVGHGTWFVINDINHYTEDRFLEIDETPIIRDNQ